MSRMRYRPRRPFLNPYMEAPCKVYVESDRDYLANNNDLAVSLLDNYGAIKRGEVLSIKHIRRQFDQARKALNDLVEAEMRKIMAHDKRLTTLLKCMGDITAYDKHGPMDRFRQYGTNEPVAVTRLADLCGEYDRAFYCRTGHPLRLTRMPDGAIKEDRSW